MADVVVVGGGIIGASAAYNLARQGVAVVLVESPANGTATEAAAGLITAMVRNETTAEWRRYAYPAMRYYHDLTAELEALDERDHGFRQLGDLTVALEDETADALPAALEQRLGFLEEHGTVGVGCAELLDAQQVKELCPVLEGVQRAIWHDQVGVVDGRKMRRALISAFVKLGGELRTGWATLNLVEGRVRGVEVDGETIPTESVIAAGGAWTSGLLKPHGVEFESFGQRGQITHVRLPDCGFVPAIGGVNKHYILSFPGDRLAFGATREDAPGEQFDYRATVGGIEENFREAQRLIPRIAEAEYVETRIGFRPSPYRSASIGRVQVVAGLHIGMDLMQGMTLGPFTGKTLATLATGGREEVLPDSWAPRI